MSDQPFTLSQVRPIRSAMTVSHPAEQVQDEPAAGDRISRTI